MWKDSIDTLLYKVAYKKEGWSTKLFSEGGQVFGKEVGQGLLKEGGQVLGKEVGQGLLKEGGQALGKEGGQGLLKEGTQGLSKESGQRFFSEGSQSAGKEFTSTAGKEFGQQTGKQVSQTGAMTTAKKAGLGGLALGSLFVLGSTETTDTNGDGVVDDKDKSLLEKGIDGAAEATGGVLGKVAGGAAGAIGNIGGSILEGLGIDPEVVKDYAVKAFWIIIILIIARVLSFLYTSMKVAKKVTGLGEGKKKINLYRSVVKKL